MLHSLSQGVGGFLYEVFVDRFDFWLVFGIGAQLVFTARFLVQWLASERAGRSVVPVAFWWLSMAGGMMTLIYGVMRRDAVIIMGQALSVFIYLRNMMLIYKEKKSSGAESKLTAPDAGKSDLGKSDLGKSDEAG